MTCFGVDPAIFLSSVGVQSRWKLTPSRGSEGKPATPCGWDAFGLIIRTTVALFANAF